MGAAAAGNIFYFDWEVDLIEWIQNTLGAFGKALADVFSIIGGETFSMIILLVIYFCYSKAAARRCSIPLMAATLWFPMIKNVALRLRPHMAHPDRVAVWQLSEPDADAMDVAQQGYSFPSGHSAMSTAIYGRMAWEVKKRWMAFLAVILPLLIGVSRFIVGAHYPTDVLAGWAVGLLALGFGRLLEKYVKKEGTRLLILAAVTVPGVFWCSSRDYYSGLGALIGLLIALPFEGHFVRFEDTRNWKYMILRVLGAGALFFLIDKGLKLPFTKEFLNSGTALSFLVRTVRYAVLVFVIMALYPMCFRLFHRKEKAAKA